MSSKRSEKPIYVTRPSLPPLEEFTPYLEDIWESRWLTNMGKYHHELEEALGNYLGVEHLSLFTNGTLALITALQVLEIKGEVITTPYSFVATTHALSWNGITPVFCDVDPVFGNLAVEKIEELITPETSAILPTHVYGNPVAVKEIEEIATRHNLSVIYDAAHAFGVKLGGRSILEFGDLSILSFHATKPFHTFEGGAIVSKDEQTKKQIDFLKNFGFVDEVTVVAPGINGKMNELQAAFGLLKLQSFDEEKDQQQEIAKLYREILQDIPGIRFLTEVEGVSHNHSYFPIFVGKDYPLSRDELYFRLREHNIHGRRYFYPLISEFPMYSHIESGRYPKLLEAHKVSREVICLPIYSDLDTSVIHLIGELIRNP